MRVLDLKVDYIECPLGLDNLSPRFSWRLESDARNVRQSAYRIWVASNEAFFQVGQGNLWDSGKISSEDCFNIVYQGKPLQSRQRCWWCVQVWAEGITSPRSAPSWWEMGLLSVEDWSAQWLAADDVVAIADRDTPLYWIWSEGDKACDGQWRYFRHRFTLEEATREGVLCFFARSFETVVGAWIDGAAVSVRYPGRDLTGENLPLGALSAATHELAVAVRRKRPWQEPIFGDPPAGLACFARLHGQSGRVVRLGSGPSWTTAAGIMHDDGSSPPADERKWSAVSTSAVEHPLLIEPALHFRREFSIDQPLAAARLYATALGCYAARLNGQPVSDALLTAEISQYERRALYRVYDVAHLMGPGLNVIGATVADGWYASHPSYPHRYVWGPPPRRFCAQLELTYADGSRQIVATDSSWRMARGAIQQSELDYGEIYDARLEQLGWDRLGFEDSQWQPAQVAVRPPCQLKAQVSPPIRVTQRLEPTAITEPFPGVYVFDFGQNFAGWCRLHVKGAPGTRVDLRFGEQLQPDGQIDQFVLLGHKAVDTYILRGDPCGETFEPHFTYHGFRYVQVTGLPAAATEETLKGVVVHTDLDTTGQLRVGHAMVQQLWRNIVWTQRSNFMGVPTDCPNRHERMAYFGDIGVFWDTAAYTMDVAAFACRQLENVRDRQYTSGALPMVAPAPDQFAIYNAAEGMAAPGWSDGGVILPWMSWRRYGDADIIERNWAAMNRHLQFILERNPNDLWINGRLKPEFGDWLAVGDDPFMHPEAPLGTPVDLIATAYWAHSADLLSQMAQATRRVADARRLRVIYERVRKAFIQAYVRPDGQIGSGSQTGYVLALRFGLVPDELRNRALENLVADIRSRGTALSTGILGTQFVLDVLADGGQVGIVYDLLLRSAPPSWGYMIAKGATTVWERWDGNLDQLHITGSHNHFALGAVGGFLFRRLVGIEEIEPGFKKIRVRPLLDARIQQAGGDYDSILGRISVDWEQVSQTRLTLEVVIPANSTAHIHMLAPAKSRIEENGKDISVHNEVCVLSRSSGETIVEVRSGLYRFEVINE